MTNIERISAHNAKLQECLTIAEGLPDAGSGGAELNIAYGDTPPDDTSKLWVKCSEPSKVHIGYELPKEEMATIAEGESGGGENIRTLSAKLPTPLQGMASSAVGNKIYLFGGYSSGYSKSIHCFNTDTESIETLSATLPVGCTPSASAVGTKIYMFGGNSASSYTNTIYRFNTDTESIETLSIVVPTTIGSMGIATVGNKIYLFGGRNGSELDAIHCFETEIILENGTLVIIQNSSGNIFPLINTDLARVEIGVDTVYKGNTNNNGEKVETAIYKDGEWVTI